MAAAAVSVADHVMMVVSAAHGTDGMGKPCRTLSDGGVVSGDMGTEREGLRIIMIWPLLVWKKEPADVPVTVSSTTR